MAFAGLLLAIAVTGSVLWYGRLASFPVRVTLSARRVTIAMGPAGVIDPYRNILLSSARTFGAASARSVPNLDGLTSGALAVRGPASLLAIRIPARASLTLDAVDAHCVDINSGSTAFEIDLQGEHATLAQGVTTWSAANPVTLTSAAMQLCFAQPAELRIYEFARLDTIESTSPLPGAPLVVSTLRSGSASLPLADRNTTFEGGEALALGAFRGVASFKLSTASSDADASVSLAASGMASEILAGAPGLERDLRPRWVEYLKARDVLGGLTAAIVLCWSIYSTAAAMLRRRE